MGGSHSREGNLSESESETETETAYESEEHSEEAQAPTTSIDSIDSKLKYLDLQNPNTNPSSLKLYLYAGGKWIISDKLTTFSFSRSDDSQSWFLVIGSKIRARIGPELQLKTSPDQLRCDFVADGVWAVKFFTRESFDSFRSQFNSYLFENAFGFESNEDNFTRVFGKDFQVWAIPEKADDSIWEDAEESFEKAAPVRVSRDLFEEFEEVASEGSKIQSLALGALDNSFLVGDLSVQVVRNFSHGVHGKGMTVNFSGGSSSGGFSTPKKALLMKAESNMLLMSPGDQERLEYSTGVHQLDIETGKIVTEWKFEKDGTDITMRDITNDTKGSQLDSSESTFLGLDDNRLCRWDMRDKRGIVQNIDSSPVLEWNQGHQFARGTNFQCFASTGDGSIVVGSLDGKIRLYSKSSMRMAKTVFPGLGSPITHVDVTYDGKWILGTTNTYLILISTVFKDKDGKEKTGFNGRMGDRIAAPRLLKLTPLDVYLAGKDNKFHGGQFSWVTEKGKQERHIVGTVGKFSIIWDFQQVKKSKHECYRNQEGLKSCYCYKIVLRDESIVDSRFMHEKFTLSDSPEAPLVVATPMKVSSFSMSNKP